MLVQKGVLFMSQAMPNSAVSPISEQGKPTKKPWLRQEGESILWYNRFCRYQDLGPKRSLQAAVEQERAQITALKSPKQPPIPKKTPRRNSKQLETSALVEVPKQKQVQVPGSWKQASVLWRWVERARAWDAYCVDHLVEQNIKLFFDEKYVMPIGRVRVLQNMADALLNDYNKDKTITHEQGIQYMARVQSIFRDIREEMKVFDEPLQRVALHHQLATYYTDHYAELLERREERRQKGQ
jgi:hypothetical protein